MEFDETGTGRIKRGPTVRETIDRFPGPIAIAAEAAATGLEVTWNSYFAEGVTTYAVVAEYDTSAEHLFAVKTFRPLPAGRVHLAIENPVNQIANYLDRADLIANPGKYRYQAGRARPHTPGNAFVAANAPFRPIAGARTTSVSVVVDSAPLAGKRVDIENCSVLELHWGDRIIFCTGSPTALDSLTLRTATLDDLPRNPPERIL